MHFETRCAGCNREPLISELADDVERLARRLFERESQLVRLHGPLDLRAHVCGRLKETVCGHEPVECLMRSLKVVVAYEVLQPLLRVDDVREHRAAQELVPQRLPEALDLAKRLRMLWPTADVLNSEPRQQLFELRPSSPHGVLPPVVREHFARVTVGGDAALEGLHYECRLLVVRQRVSDHEPAVVVHEHAHIEPLRPTQPEREDVRLPELIRYRALEPPRRMLALLRRRRRLDEPLLVKDAPHLLLAHAKRREPGKHVANPPRAPLLMFTLEGDNLLAHRRFL